MGLNAKTGAMTWPDKLVWSSSEEVQLLLANIPMVALGLLGLASMTLLLVTKRLYVSLTVV
jgi:hypothetical protein